MSTYSPSLRIELITTGDQAGTWGNTTNTNLGTLLEAAITGYVSVSITSANQALTAINGADDQSRNIAIALTTTTTAPFNVYAPPVEKTYILYNASAYTATIYNSTVLGNTTAAGTGVVIPPGKTTVVWTDGTSFRTQVDHLGSLTLTTDLAVADGGTGASTASAARTNLGAASSGANTDITSLGGLTTPLSIAQGGTGSTTATGARTNISAAASGANSDITSISGLTTALSVGQGGTGSTTAAGARTNLSAAASGADSDITSISGLTTALSVGQGGTGATTAAGARTNLSAAASGANSDITSISGLTTALSVLQGGTGATTATGARTNLGLVIGTDVPSPTGTGASGTWGISITGNAAGNAGTATKLQTARTINGVAFDGTANITISSASANALTMNSSGTGAVSGTTYDGSTPVR